MIDLKVIAREAFGSEIIKEVETEVVRQRVKWGTQNHKPPVYLTIMVEEVGEVARAILDQNIHHAREELVQVAAVAVSMIQAIDRDGFCECELCKDKKL